MTTKEIGRLVTAMVTPFRRDGELDIARARQLADRLVDEQHNEAILVNGTTGESPTTTSDEKIALVKAVKEQLGERAGVIAGVGTNDTRSSIEMAKRSADAGADALLAVTPYYSLPPQDAIISHFMHLADATDLPVILYDIPHRTGRPIETESLLELAKHPNIIGVKDAKKDMVAAASVLAQTDLRYWAGDDAKVLPELAIGGYGVVGTSTHFTGRRTRELIDAYLAGDQDKALTIYRELLPVYTGVFATQGVMLVKAGLAHLGFPVGGVRPPLLEANESQAKAFGAILDAVKL